MKTILLTAGLIAGTLLSLPVLAQVGQDQPQPSAVIRPGAPQSIAEQDLVAIEGRDPAAADGR